MIGSYDIEQTQGLMVDSKHEVGSEIDEAGSHHTAGSAALMSAA